MMKKLFGTALTVVVAGAAVVAGKLCYDAFQEKKKRDFLDQEFFDDLDDDFDEFEPEPVSATPVKPVAPRAEAKVETPKAEPKKEEPKKAAPKATVKKPAAKKTTAKKTSTKKAATLTCQDVIDCTSDVFGVSSEDILSKSRKADIANARRVAIYVCATELKATNAVICEEFGGIGATSVSNAKKNVGDKIKTDSELKADVDDILAEMKRLEKSFNKK